MDHRRKSLTSREAARILGVSVSEISYLIRHGRLKAEKFGPLWKILPSSLDAIRYGQPGRPKGSKNKEKEYSEIP